MVSGEESEQAPEGSSGDCMGPPSVAGTSGENQQSEQQEEMVEGDDEVSSEGEKQPSTEEGVEEGREAEASQSTNTKSLTPGSNQQNVIRRSARQLLRVGSRPVPTPIVWASDQQRNSPRQGCCTEKFSSF